ncbi:MAG: hypothetical protein ACPGVZ_04360 [Myxococcota bacterium]
MLPFFAMLLFALLGIGALIVDGGLALAEQSRLETTAEMVASEWGHVQASPGVWPADCEPLSGDALRRCLERAYIAPLLEPLGVDLDDAGTPSQRWARSDMALDGVAIDARGVRLGALDDPDPIGGDWSNVRLSRSSPLLFGWAAIAPQTTGGVATNFEALQAARNTQGLAPEDSTGGGVYGEGFSLEANAVVDLRGALALWAGPAIPDPVASQALPEDDDYLTGGVVPIAWRLQQLGALDGALGSGASLLLGLDESDGQTLTNEQGEVVACRFEPPNGGLSVGERLANPFSALGADLWPTAYLPVIETPDCDLAAPQVLGFLELALDSRTRDILIGASAGLRRNAAALPPEGADVDDVTALRVETTSGAVLESIWVGTALTYALRVPSPASFGDGSGFAQLESP